MRRIFLILTLIPLILMASPDTLSQQKIDQIMAPIALYPDALLSQILIASTYPEQIQEAVQWSRQNSNLQEEDALEAAASNNWDPSVTSLVAFPQILDMMGKHPDWVQEMGSAFLAEPDTIMDSVQRLRIQAQKNGNLTSSQKQTIITQDNQGTRTIIIQPTSSNTVYIPVYNPMQVYGSWFYPAYEPFFYYPPYFYMAPGVYFGFSLGIGIGDIMWSDFDWYHHDVYINVPRYNAFYPHRKINQNQKNISWKNEWRSKNPHTLNYKTPQTQRINFKTNDYKSNDNNVQNHERKSNDGNMNNNNDRNNFQHGQRND